MLAYVFWHVARPGVSPPAYEERLAAFHAALRREPPPGLGPTTTVGLAAVPWLGDAPGYEDWYLVDDFTALGALNAAAVSGTRREPHDAAAGWAADGVAGVMAHVAGPLLPDPGPTWSAWLAKPAGVGYGDFHAALAGLGGGAGAWQRQMVLGPATEYCVLAPEPLTLPWPARWSWSLRPVVQAPSTGSDAATDPRV
jgi:hypothetical protein